MQNAYLDEKHSDAFVDFPGVKERPTWGDQNKMHPCPRCKQHGGWNLRLNAYPLRDGMDDTPNNRHKHSHFRASCSSCWGWGWLEDECAHEYGPPGRSVGRCLSEWTCRLCGKTTVVDSSD